MSGFCISSFQDYFMRKMLFVKDFKFALSTYCFFSWGSISCTSWYLHISHCREKNHWSPFDDLELHRAVIPSWASPSAARSWMKAQLLCFCLKKLQNCVPCLIGSKCFRDSSMHNWIWIDGIKKKDQDTGKKEKKMDYPQPWKKRQWKQEKMRKVWRITNIKNLSKYDLIS